MNGITYIYILSRLMYAFWYRSHNENAMTIEIGMGKLSTLVVCWFALRCASRNFFLNFCFFSTTHKKGKSMVYPQSGWKERMCFFLNSLSHFPTSRLLDRMWFWWWTTRITYWIGKFGGWQVDLNRQRQRPKRMSPSELRTNFIHHCSFKLFRKELTCC